MLYSLNNRYSVQYVNIFTIPLTSCTIQDQEQTTGTVSDIDGNEYKTIRIGKQWWMAENLWVTRYKNGADIPNITDGEEWCKLTSGAYCAYDNDAKTSLLTASFITVMRRLTVKASALKVGMYPQTRNGWN